jgi:CMP/dCMP kinase
MSSTTEPVASGARERVVAIDGPGGAGKSTIGRRVAERLGLSVLDTGAMYRALCLAAKRAGIALDDEAALGVAAAELDLELAPSGEVLLGGEDVSEAIRAPEIDAEVSAVAAHPTVRAELVRRQRAWVDEHGGGVLEGRDIASVVVPEARVKVYLTASEEERARRRALERGDLGEVAEIEAAIAHRDALDSGRAASPLVSVDAALVIDSTGRSIEEIVEEIVSRW